MKESGSAGIAFIGLGAMGMGMATSLLKAGFAVRGYDIRREAVEAFIAAGGTGAASSREAAEHAELLVLSLVSASQVEEVLFSDGAAEALPEKSVVIQTGTTSPDFTRELARRLSAAGVAMVDAPVSGGTARAAAGTLSIMSSGPPDALCRAEAALDAMAAKVYRLGDECGIGSTVKMVNQHLAGVHIAASAEAMAFGVRAGADPDMLYEVISNSAGSSWIFENRVPHMLSGDFTPLSAVDIFVKDLGIVLETGGHDRFPLPLAAAAHQLFLAASSSGMGREDDSAVVKLYEKVSGRAVRSAAGGDAATEAGDATGEKR